MSHAALIKTFVLSNRRGLHARPSGAIVRAMMKFQSSATLQVNGVMADSRSIMDLLMLGAQHEDQLTVTVKGEDAEACLAALAELIEDGFGERD
jgi:phosphocarrier protein